jgi:hypothetical protein
MEKIMTEEDEAFNNIERQARQRKEAVKAAMRRVEEDDDIQIYQRPWVGLTDEERNALLHLTITHSAIDFAKACEAKLKEKNT